MFLFSQVVVGKENKAPAERSQYEITKAPTLAAGSSIPPARRVFGVKNKVNVKSGILTGQHDTTHPCATNGPAQPKLNPVLTRMYTIKSSKTNQNTASLLKKQPNTGMQSSGRAFSKAVHTNVTKSNSRFSSASSATWTGPMKTLSARLSLGPIVQTKTGLIPAVTQPRNSQNLIHTSATAGNTSTTTSTTSVANNVQPRTCSSVFVSKRSSVAKRKTLPTTVQNNTVNGRKTAPSTARAGIKVQDRDSANSRPLLGKHPQPSCKSKVSNGLKLISSSSKCPAAPIKPEERIGMSKTNKSSGQPTDRSSKQRTEGEGQKNGTLGPVSRSISRVVGGVSRAAVAEHGGKTKTLKDKDSKRGHSSAIPLQPQTGIKRTGVPVMSQTVPQPTRTIRYTSQAKDIKMTKAPVRVIPQTEGKKLTAAQEERM